MYIVLLYTLPTFFKNIDHLHGRKLQRNASPSRGMRHEATAQSTARPPTLTLTTCITANYVQRKCKSVMHAHALHAIVVNPDSVRRQATGDVRVVSGMLSGLKLVKSSTKGSVKPFFYNSQTSQSVTHATRIISFLHRDTVFTDSHEPFWRCEICILPYDTIRYVRRRSCRRNNKVCPPLLYLNYPRS